MPSPITTSETLVNTSTIGDQMDPTVTILADGSFVVVWMGRAAIGSEMGIFAQRYAADGTPIGSEFQVNSASVDQWESGPSVAALPDGGWIVSWYVQSPHGGPSPEDALVFMQRYDATGTPAGEVQVNSPDGYISGLFPEVTVLADGGWVIVWMSQHGGTDPNAYNEDIYGQRFDSSGAPVGGEFLINSATGFRQHLPSVTALGDGGWIVTWMSQGQDGSGWGVYSQRYNADGSLNGGETLVTTTTAGDQRDPQLAALGDGGWLITWSSSGQDGSGAGIFAQRYDSSGAPVGGEFQVNTTTASDQLYATVAALPDGGWAITWLSITPGFDPYGGRIGNVYVQRYDSAGNAVGDEILVGTASEGSFSNLSTRVAALPDGSLVVTWGQYGTDGSGYGVYALTINAPTNVINGTEGDDILVGTPDDDVINGLGGNDTLSGLGGNDEVNGGDGNDMLTGGAGDDSIDGGEGNDTASWLDTAGPISVNLGTGTASAPDGTDALAGVENVLGSEFADTMIGDANANLLAGFGGDDLIIGGDGGDSLGGGDGNDSLSGGAGFDLLTGDEGDDTLQGGQDDDVLYGGAGADLLVGNQGADLLDGGDGDDSVVGGPGNDTLYGGSGHDFLRGDNGDGLTPADDYIDGGSGFDRATYYNLNNGVTVSLLLQGAPQNTGQGWDTLVNIEAISGSVFSDVLTGDDNDNWFTTGGAGLDSHTVTSDTINANGGNDMIIAGLGDHNLDGGTGVDTVGFGWIRTEVFGGVTVSLLLQGASQDTGQGMMTLSDFENLSGSVYGDVLTGDSGANLLAGNAGSDVLSGGDGNDVLLGDGEVNMSPRNSGPPTTFDDLEYSGVDFYDSAGTIVFLFEGQDLYDADGNQLLRTDLVDEFGDPYSQFVMNGISYNFYGGVGSQPISDGIPGNDVLDGGKGDDRLLGGRGDDVMTGGSGFDEFVIGAASGNDTITDFKPKEDVITFGPASGVDEFADLIFTQVGKDTRVSWGTDDSILLEGVKADKLAESDFQFGTASLSLLRTAGSDTSGDQGISLSHLIPSDLLL